VITGGRVVDLHDIATLASSPLFSGIAVGRLGSALASLPLRVQSFEAGRVVLLAGCAYEDLRVLLEGDASAEMTSGEGKTIIVETLRAPDAIATAVLFSPSRRLPVTLVATTKLRLVVIPRAALLSLSATFPPLLEALLSDMGGRLAFLADKYRSLSFATLRERLADWLLRGAQRRGGRLEVRLETSKERLASVFGVARPSLSREFGQLEERGLVEVKGRTILILDEAGLMALRPR
jgi:CRP-like cAMP-binding protein